MYIHIRAQVGQHPPDDVKLLFEGGSYFFVLALRAATIRGRLQFDVRLLFE